MVSILFPLVQKQDLIFLFILKNSITLIIGTIIFFLIYKKYFKYSLYFLVFCISIYAIIWMWIVYKNFIKYSFAWYELGAIWLGIYGISILFVIILLPIFLTEFWCFMRDVIWKDISLYRVKSTKKHLLIIAAILFIYFVLSLMLYLI